MISFLLRRLEASPYRRQVKAAAESVFWVAGSILRKVPGEPRCPVCSARLVCLYRPVMGDELVGEWGIDETWRSLIDRREGEVCLGCGSSLRVRQVAAALLGWLAERGGKAATLGAALREDVLPKLSVAEINSCGAMHATLVRLPNLAYSEYSPESPNVAHEDLLALSYPDESFDLVLHSDSLEHVPDIDRALSEIYRVLKPGGASIFSVPIILDGRKTVVRAEHRDGLGDELADVVIVVGADSGDLAEVFLALALDGHGVDGLGGGDGGLVDAALQVDGVGAGGHESKTFGEDGLGEDGGGGGAVAGLIGGLLGDFVDHLGAHGLEGLGERDFLGDRDAVLGDGGTAVGLLDDDMAASGPHGALDGLGETIDTLLHFKEGGVLEHDLFCGHG
jgi:SAM-dependent methyltransferase